MPNLTDLLNQNGDGGGLPTDLWQLWENTAAAPELKPLPAGSYDAVLESTVLATSSRGTPAVRLTFRIEAGEHAGRKLTCDCWLTPRALPYTKRDLLRIGITDLGQVGRPLPAAVSCRLRVALRRDDGGQEFNRISNFEVLRVDPLPADPFAPEAGPAEATERAAAEGLPF